MVVNMVIIGPMIPGTPGTGHLQVGTLGGAATTGVATIHGVGVTTHGPMEPTMRL